MTDNRNSNPIDWINQLNQQLADHQEPAPEGLWDRIEAQLDAETHQQPVIVPGTQRHTSLRRWMAAASVALLIGSGAYIFMYKTPTSMENTPSQTNKVVAKTNMISSKAVTNTSPSTTTSVTPSATKVQTLLAQNTVATTHPLPSLELSSQLTDVMPIQEAPSVAVPTETPPAATNMEATPPSNPSQEKASASSQQKKTITRPSLEDRMSIGTSLGNERGIGTSSSHEKEAGVNFSLYAQNSLVAQQQNSPVLMSDELYSQFNGIDKVATSNRFRRSVPQNNIFLSNYNEQSHHHLPLAIGLTFSYPLGDKMSILSGLVYTYAASDFQRTMQGSTINTQQKLQYLGIPLQLNYTFLQWQALSLYASGGGQADINIKARRTTEGIPVEANRDRMQWSLTGAIGAQYPILPHLAFYGEAGARWYINNRSSVETYFKEHPLSPNLQVGLRLTLGEE